MVNSSINRTYVSPIQHVSAESIDLAPLPEVAAPAKQRDAIVSTAPALSSGLVLPAQPTIMADTVPGHTMSLMRSASIITTIAGVTFIACIGTGILTTALPRIASDIGLDESLLLWPASVYALASGCTLLAFGSIADIVGPKRMWLGGSGGSCVLILACGLSRTGIQLIVFRASLGLAVAMCLPSSMSLITSSFPAGSKRNIAFAASGMGQPIGYAVGLILGGIFTDTIGWRYGFYMTAGIQLGLSVLSYFALPVDHQDGSPSSTLHRLRYSIDWIGLALLSACFGILSYVLALVTLSYTNISKPQFIVLLIVSLLCLPIFVLWVGRQERLGKPTLIPNSFWSGRAFTSICITMFFSWAAFNAFQYQTTLFFEKVQQVSALQASIRFLPMAIIGIATNIVTGYLVDKVDVNLLVSTATIITAISPVLMAIAKPHWSYWRGSFVPMILSPISGDVLFTVSSLIISRTFPSTSQSVAGGVFNTVAQLGNSIGLAVTAAIATSVSAHAQMHQNETTSDALEQGYLAAFWTIFSGLVVACIVSLWGLRKVGKVGEKLD